MFNKPTVLIIGAGASAEFNMPVGADLMGRIGAAVNSGGEGQISDELLARRIQECLGPEHAERLLRYGPRLTAVISQFVSMDEALHFLSAEPDIVELGKLAIAHEIMKAERHSHLYGAIHDNRSGVEVSNNSWTNRFLQMALSASRRHEVSSMFANVTIIDFNYDRVLPQYLYWALQHNLELPQAMAADCVNNLKILHPYGSLGHLEWQASTDFLQFGADQANLAEIAGRIRTYTEEVGGPEQAKLRTLIDSAKLFVVIGFGFHRQNIQIVSGTAPHKRAPIFMTVYAVDHDNHAAVQLEMQNALRSEQSPQLFGGIGRNFLREVGLAIKLAAS
jgi:hypothetical protein